MRTLAIAALLTLTGCTTVPVGSVALCVGLCRFTITPSAPQSAASQIGGGLADLLANKFGNKP
jgi:hypothetical protein